MKVNSAFNNPYRWVVLMVFFGVAAMSQMLWLNLAPLISYLQEHYHVDELTAGSLLFSFPLLYVLLSIHSGVLIDKKGYKFVIALGSIVSTIFAGLRIFDDSFWVLFIGQTGIAAGQPYIINGISKLTSDWFSKEQGALATGIGTCGMLIGMALGMGLTPVLNSGFGFRITMVVFAAISGLLTLLFIFFCKENSSNKADSSSLKINSELKSLFANKNLITLFIISFLAIGFFNGLTTWLEPILLPNGINSEQAGMAGAYLILGGIAGSVIVPGLSDKFRIRKPFLILCCAAALGLLYPLCSLHSLIAVYVFGALMGFFFLPGYALLLSMCEELAGNERAGAATGILMLAGNAGAVVVIILMPLVKGANPEWTNAVYLMMGLLVFTLLIMWFYLKETFSNGSH